MDLAPLKFQPVSHSKIWGGAKLFQLLGKGTSADRNIGEIWELSDNNAGLSLVLGGPQDGRSFRDILSEFRVEILGKHSAVHDHFPLLYKFIDARENLSVQVHPGEDSSLGPSKTEAWVVVDAPPGAVIIVGIASSDSPRVILEKLKSPEAPGVLNSIPVSSGDVLLIPAGTVHAITAGLVIYEVQQNSDTTFRLFDWNRVDDAGRSRPLHVKEAAEVIDYTVHQKHKVKPLKIPSATATIRVLTACPYFALMEYQSPDRHLIPLNDHFVVLTCLAGKVEVSGGFGSLTLELGETLLVPAVCQALSLKQMEEKSKVISSFIPDLGPEIVEPLRAAGHDRESINRLGGNRYTLW